MNVNNDTLQVGKLIEKSVYYRNYNPDSAKVFSENALELAIHSGNQSYISLALQEVGRYCILAEDFGQATDKFLQALKIEEEKGNKIRIAELSDDMGYIYYLMERFQMSLDYYNKAFNVFGASNNSAGMARVLSHIGNLHNSRQFCETRTKEQQTTDYETAITYYTRALEICKKKNEKGGIANLEINLANAYNKLNKPVISENFLQSALEYYKQEDEPSGLIDVYYNFGMLYTELKNYRKAIDSYLKSLSIALEHNQTQGIQFLYEHIAYTYELAEQYEYSLNYYKKYMTLRDSIYNSGKSNQIFELETKYQTEKKEKEILKLTLDKKRKNFLIAFLSVILISIIIITWFVLLRSRQKRILAEQTATIKEQKIKELEQEKMLVATQSVLTGEETERRRLARDLHDGLGGMLSGIKLKLTNMKGNFILDEKGKSDFENALEMLDKSVHELRQVAHNMMPEALIKFGLKDALGDFCSSFDKLKNIQIKFRFYGDNIRTEQNIEIALYRIAQELVNNALKHSEASEILVDLVRDSARISLTVMDNGKGFDTNRIKEFKGMGLNSLKSRVDALKGAIDILSEPGKGTEVRVEVFL